MVLTAVLVLIVLVLSAQAFYFRNSYAVIFGVHAFMKQVEFVKNDQKVILQGMVHIGPQSFYDYIMRTFDNLETLSLTEGVRSRKSPNAVHPYDTFAKKLGLSCQTHCYLETNSINADIRLSQLSKATLKQIDLIFKAMSVLFADTNEPFTKSEFNMLRKSNKNKVFHSSKHELIHKRNNHLLRVLSKQTAKNILLPWGAAHLPDLEEKLIAQGYRKSKVRFIQFLNLLTVAIPVARFFVSVALRLKRRKK